MLARVIRLLASGRALLLLGVIGLAGCSSWPPNKLPLLPAPASDDPRRATELPPERAAAACLAAARELEEKGYLPEAIEQYEKARRYDPHLTATVTRRLAVLYDRQGQYDRATVEYDRALHAQSPDAPLLNDFGYFCYERGQLDAAEKYLRLALRKDPSYNCAWVNLGTVLASAGREQESVEAFAKVVSTAAAYSNLGVLLAKQGKQEQARQALRHALTLDPTIPQAQAFLRALETPSSEGTAAAPAEITRAARDDPATTTATGRQPQ